MEHSTEIRWFTTGALPVEVAHWFAAFPGVAPEEPRIDTYLPLPGSSVVGIKLRAGSLEIKAQCEPPVDVGFPHDVAGRRDGWVKLSLGGPQLGRALEEAVKGMPRLQVGKRRSLQRYALQGHAFRLAEAEEEPGAGCHVELASLELDGEEFWTLALEAFGPVELRTAGLTRVAHHLFGSAPPVPLRRESSMPYPAWLLLLQTQDGRVRAC